MSNGSEESSWRMPQPSIGDAVLFASDVNSMNRATLGLIVSPPGDSAGGAFLAFSQKALQAIETSTYPRCFLDLKDQMNANKDGYTPYTPNLPLLYGLRKALDMLLAGFSAATFLSQV